MLYCYNITNRYTKISISQSLGCSVSIPMRKLSTREPYAKESHVQFGGRGDFFPTPIEKIILKQHKESTI